MLINSRTCIYFLLFDLLTGSYANHSKVIMVVLSEYVT